MISKTEIGLTCAIESNLLDNDGSQAGDQDAPQHQKSKAQKPLYQKPVLVSYGDVRDITLGPTLGTTESGCAGVFRPGSGLPPGTVCPPGGN